MIPRSRRSLSRTKASVKVSMHTSDRQVARGWSAACKERVGVGGGAHREWCSVGERGDEERLWVYAWCLREVYKKEYNVRGRFRSHVSAGSAEMFD